jgi:hypothetical protein
LAEQVAVTGLAVDVEGDDVGLLEDFLEERRLALPRARTSATSLKMTRMPAASGGSESCEPYGRSPHAE